jgi:hypothetical protein
MTCSVTVYLSFLIGAFVMAKRNSGVKFDKIALELGRMDMAWARIEDLLDAFVAQFLHLKERSDLSRCITANADLRSKIQMAKSLAFLRKTDDDWFNHLNRSLDAIDNHIRPQRNSYIHAHWFQPKRVVVREIRKTKLHRPQSRQLALSTYQEFPVKPSDVKKICAEMTQTWFDLLPVYWYAMPDPGKPQNSDGPLPQLSFRQYLRGLELTMHRPRVSRKRKHQQQ